MTVLTVPTIDITRWATGGDQDRTSIARSVDDAARTSGFMQIVGHGIPDDVVAGLGNAIDSFFGLPLDVKQGLRPASPKINRGYSAPRSERLSYSLGIESPEDLFEAFNVGRQASDYPGLHLPEDVYAANLWPATPAAFRSAVQTWFAHATALAHRMTDIFALALSLPQDYFAASTDHSIDVLRLNHYRIAENDVRLETGQLGMGPHTDFGILTILWADALAGLQILDPDGRWHDVIPGDGGLLVNLGDLLAWWTNDRWKSTLHRVLAPVDADGRPYRRRSAAFFHDGNFDAVISTAVPNAGGHKDRYSPITVSDHLAAKLAGSRSLELNAAAVHDAERLQRT
jgi:isopenicillin N synthase-like dioxygenase